MSGQCQTPDFTYGCQGVVEVFELKTGTTNTVFEGSHHVCMMDGPERGRSSAAHGGQGEGSAQQGLGMALREGMDGELIEEMESIGFENRLEQEGLHYLL